MAAALAMLAALADDQVEEAIKANARRNPLSPGLLDAAVLREMVRKTREQRYSAMPVIGVPGVRAVGYPVCLPGGRVVAAISISAIEPRVTPEREKMLASTLKGAVRDLVSAISGSPVPGRAGTFP